MDKNTAIRILQSVRDNEMSVEEALALLREAPYTDLGYAKVDNHRELRQGVPRSFTAHPRLMSR